MKQVDATLPTVRRGFPAEIALLLACARRTMTREDRDAAAGAIDRGIDWPRLVAMGNAHGLTALIMQHVTRGDVDRAKIPAESYAALVARHRVVARRCLRLSRELVQLLRAFANERIRIVALKGPVLAQMVYGAVTLRRFNDLDLLCADGDQTRSVGVLHDRGFRSERPPYSVDARSQARLAARAKDVTLFDPSGYYRVELHRAFLEPSAHRDYSINGLDERLDQTTFFGEAVCTLPLEELLVYQCAHGARHAWTRIEWIATIAELLRSQLVLDWTRVEEVARHYGEYRRVCIGVQLAHALLGAPAPARLLFHGGRLEWGAEHVIERLQRAAGTASPLERFEYVLRTHDTMREAGAHCWSLLANPTIADVHRVPLPHRLWPLYAVVRPARLLARLAGGGYR